jgi:hypothetical protein
VIKSYCILITLSLVLLGSTLHAEQRRLSQKGSYGYLVRSYAVLRSPAKLSYDLADIFAGKVRIDSKQYLYDLIVPREGRVRFLLRSGGRSKDKLFFRGKARTINKKQSVSRSGKGNHYHYSWASSTVSKNDKNELYISFSFVTQSRRGVKRFFKLKQFDSTSSPLKIIQAPEYIIKNKHCAEHIRFESSLEGEGSSDSSPNNLGNEKTGDPAENQDEITSDSVFRRVIVGSDADVEFVNRFGTANTPLVTAEIVNTASAIFETQMSLKFTVGKNLFQTQTSVYPPSMTDSSTLLERFQSISEFNNLFPGTDVKILFSGKNFDENVIGLAYFGTACRNADDSYLLVQHLNEAIDPIITAHELGHIFGADHTSSGIMTTTLGSDIPTQFSSASLGQMQTYLNAFGKSCFPFVSATPAPTATQQVTATTAPKTTITQTPVLAKPSSTPDGVLPTSTVTATPSTPSSGGSPRILDESPVPVLKLSLGKNRIAGQVTFVKDTSDSSSCVINLIAEVEDSRSLRLSNVITATTTGEGISFSGNLRERISRREFGKKISFFARNSCSNSTTSRSRSVRINPSRVTARREVDLNRWIKGLSRVIDITEEN